MLPDGNVLGYQGEHHATLLSITPPTEMTECEEIAGYKVAFQLNNCRCCHSELIDKAPSVDILLSSQITSSKEISVQLEGYSADGNLVIKSKKVTKLLFDDSVAGTNVIYNDREHGTTADIAANTFARHTHSNADVLNEFGENAEGKPTYKDEVIGGAAFERPTETKIFLNDFSYEPNMDTSSTVADRIYINALRDEQNDLSGKEVKKIEYSINGEWVDIRDLISKYPTHAYAINMNRSFQYTDMQDNDTVCFAVIGYIVTGGNEFMQEINNSNQDGFRVTYYTD